MKRSIEILAFGTLAVGLHLVMLTRMPDGGAEAGGIGGEAIVSLSGATPQIEEAVANWTRRPDVIRQVQDTVKPPEAIVVNDVAAPTLDLTVAPNAQVKMAALTPVAPPEVPQIDTQPPPPPPQPEPVKKEEPAPEPAQEKPKPKRKTVKKPGKKNTQASAGAATQKAAGSGGSKQAGAAGKAAVKTLSAGRKAKLASIWGAKIRSRIERQKRRPRSAKGKGSIVVQIKVSRSGQMLASQIVKSSGNAAFDQAALSAVRRAAPFPAAPKGLDKSSYRIDVPINFKK